MWGERKNRGGGAKLVSYVEKAIACGGYFRVILIYPLM